MPNAPAQYRPAHSTPRDESQWASRRTEYRAWYQTPLWRKLASLIRREEPLCRECNKRGEMHRTQVIDHIVPFKGNWQLFADRDNLQGLCKPCHDRKTALEDGGFGNKDLRQSLPNIP